MNSFFLVKRTGTYADPMASCGLAGLLNAAGATSVQIVDEGWGYRIDAALPQGVDGLAYDELQASCGYDYVFLPRKDGTSDLDRPHADWIDYAAERERLKSWRERRDLLRKNKTVLTDDVEAELKQLSPREGWYLYQNFNVLQAFGSYNSLHAEIRRADPEGFKEAVETRLIALEQQQDPADISTKFAPKVSAVQALNPSIGKGVNRAKPNGTTLAGLPSTFVDWFEEWLRYIGVGHSTYALSVDKDIKVVTIAPSDIEYHQLLGVWKSLVSVSTPWSSVSMDINLVLGLARYLLERSGLGREDEHDDPLALLGRAPADVVSGLQTAYFTSLGNARALTNTSFIGLPGWFPVTEESYSDWLAIIDEHRGIIGGLDDDLSEELRLLVLYRDFLSARSTGLSFFLRMLAGYASHVLRAREQKNRRSAVRQFTVPLLRRLVVAMQPRYQQILENDGFRNIAAAIRRATVSEQYAKARGNQQYEIRYGLFQDLERKAHFPGEFLKALGEFVIAYDVENARHAERMARPGASEDSYRRARVTTQDLLSFTALMDEFGKESDVVATLLLAYASAREPREQSPADSENPPVPETAQ